MIYSGSFTQEGLSGKGVFKSFYFLVWGEQHAPWCSRLRAGLGSISGAGICTEDGTAGTGQAKRFNLWTSSLACHKVFF